NGSAQLVAAVQADRVYRGVAVNPVLSATGIPATLTGLGISAAVPKNARRVRGYLQIANPSASASYGMAIAADANGTDYQYMQAYVQSGAENGASWPFDVALTTPQSIAYEQVGVNTSGTYSIQITGYEI
ncbi:MAG: hypothetical protein KGL35_05535, partial [Bradyrhizobium sp.]|nr:hypothetical protein [Bradyrhizobium sp.]